MPSPAAANVRPLASTDLDAVVAVDAAIEGRTRREYIERRLRAAQREPALHAQFGVDDGRGLAGYILARVLAGEFGHSHRVLRLELIGLRADRRRAGLGRALYAALTDWARRHHCTEVHTLAHWRDTPMLAWFGAVGFELAPELIVDCAVEGGAYRSARDDPPADPAQQERGEIDYGRGEANDHERLARDAVDVRTMTPSDLDAIVRIDRSITGRDRRDYITARLAEAINDTRVRISLAARSDDAVVGYLMARADLGDFGRPEPVAVLDTLGVDPDVAHHGVGHALLSQLFANLGALRVERVETLVALRDLALLGFLYSAGFAPAQQLALVHPLGTSAG
jgi:predicted N-acetyltransferase YhbS